MFDRASRPTITESVVESADSAVESADYWSRLTGNWPSRYGPLVSCAIFSSLAFYEDVKRKYFMVCKNCILELSPFPHLSVYDSVSLQVSRIKNQAIQLVEQNRTPKSLN